MIASMTRRSALAMGAASLFRLSSSRGATAATTMKVAYATGTDFYHHKAALAFKSEVEKTTDGAMVVELYPTGQLGGEAQILEGVRAGTIEAYIGTCGALSNFVPQLGLLDMAYLWADPTRAIATLNGPLGDRLKQPASAKGFVIVGFWPAGRRDVYGNKRIEKPEDFRGVKIRTLQTPAFVATFKALGALPTPLAWPETYGALQQGVIDASETALSAMLDAHQDEVVKFVTLTGHALTIATLTAGEPWFSSLPAEQRAAITAAELKARALAVDLDRHAFEDAVAALSRGGKTILSPEIAPFQEIIHKTVYPQFATRFDAALMREISGG
jgi:TRAP-type transport system periplasmic protein